MTQNKNFHQIYDNPILDHIFKRANEIDRKMRSQERKKVPRVFHKLPRANRLFLSVFKR